MAFLPVTPARVSACLLLTLLLLTPALVAAQTPDACADVFSRAEDAFYESNFDAAINLLTPCVYDAASTTRPAARTYRLLSMAYMNKGDAFGARQTILQLLEQQPNYAPDPVQDPPSYTVMVLIIGDQLRNARGVDDCVAPAQQTSWTRRRGTWLAIGGGLLAVGLAAVFTGER